MSEPAGHAALVAGLSSDIGALNRVIQGLLVHSDWLTAYGLDEAAYNAVSRDTLPVAVRLDRILATDARDLATPRPAGKRSVGTCRDFALMLCSFLRDKGVAARVRCGFADYFGAAWEDHWVCEYWDAQAGTWRLSDAQMDGLLCSKCQVSFDPADVPRRAFMTAGEAWLACRAATHDADHFGHGGVIGAWFIKVNVVRDHYVVNGREISAWDGWRAAPMAGRAVDKHEFALLDGLAADPEQPLVDMAPGWAG